METSCQTQFPEQHKHEIFSRYEFKYILDVNRRDEIEQEISHFMTYDGYVHKELDNSYFVRSLYFDNDWASHYHEKIDGIKSRSKFRIRTYGRVFDKRLPLYLEKKGRIVDRSYKERIGFPFSQLPIFLNNDRHRELKQIYTDDKLIDQFLYDSLKKKIKPKVLVDYIRRPYTSYFDVNFRVTFDSSLTAAATNHIFPSQKENWVKSKAGYTILEVKFHRRIPSWFHRLIQVFNMRRVSISKFCKGMEVTGQAGDL